MEYPQSLKIFEPITAVLLLSIAILGGYLPYFFSKKRNFDSVMSYLNCVSGGILAGVALLHILPETGETMNESCGGFPLSYVVMFSGVVLMTLMLNMGHEHKPCCELHESAQESAEMHNYKLEKGEKYEKYENEPRTIYTQPTHDCETPDDIITAEDTAHESHSHQHSHKPTKNSILMLLFGLLIHDISEGMVLGLQTSFSEALYLAIAIFLHKWCDVSVEVVTGIRGGNSKKDNLLLCIPLVVATPLTQMIAFAVVLATTKSSIPKSLIITQDFFMSFACGTFLTIVYLEILASELTDRPRKQLLKRLAAFIGGFFIISISNIVETIGDQ